MRRRIEVDVFGTNIRVDDIVENRGFRPTPHAILYHVNFGYPFLDEVTQISGDLDGDLMSAFNGEDKRPRDDFVDYFQEFPVVSTTPKACVEVRNEALIGGVRARISYPCKLLPNFGGWRAFQSGVYAHALEPMRRAEPGNRTNEWAGTLGAGETAAYWLELQLSSIHR